tara:strand:+ start:20866 stop:21345 length:480 start_codon:yes stop_codon:yes gene_type:complete
MRKRSTTSAFLAACLIATSLGAGLSGPASASSGGGGGGGGQASSGEDERHRSLTSSDTYLPLPTLITSVQSNRRARGMLQIEAGLEIEDSRLRRRVEASMPRLRNAYVTAMSIYTGVNYRFGDVPDSDRIAQLLQDATDRTLGEEGAHLLLGMVLINAQ